MLGRCSSAAEQGSHKPRVGGSIPPTATNPHPTLRVAICRPPHGVWLTLWLSRAAIVLHVPDRRPAEVVPEHPRHAGAFCKSRIRRPTGRPRLRVCANRAESDQRFGRSVTPLPPSCALHPTVESAPCFEM